jgi:hypothetical protein
MIDDTYIAFVVPRGRIEVDGRGTVWDLDAEATDASALRFTWADASTSLVDWINSKRPPVLMEHGDGEHGTHVFGYAIDAFVATAEAGARGWR